MAELEQFFFVTTCKGVQHDVEPSASISLALNVKWTIPTVACPFAKITELLDNGGKEIKCVAPFPEIRMSNEQALKFPNCYQLERKGVFK